MQSDDQELEIDIIDLARTVAKHWLAILLGAVIGLALGGLLLLRTTRAESDEARQAALQSIRDALSAASAIEVEAMYQQYQTYASAQESLKDASAQAAYWSVGVGKGVRRTTTYHMEARISDTEGKASDVAGLLEEMALHQEDYDRIAQILGVASEDARGMVSFDTIYRNLDETYRATAPGVGERDASATDAGQGYAGSTIFSVGITATDRQACDEAHAVVEEALAARVDLFRSVDPDVVLEEVSVDYDELSADDILAMRTANTQKQAGIASMLADFESHVADQLDEGQQVYFKALKEYDDSKAKGTGHQTLKYLALGTVAGAFAVCVYLALRYMMDGTVKTVGELQWSGMAPHMGELRRKGMDEAQGTALCAADIKMSLERVHAAQLLLCVEARDLEATEALSGALKERGVKVCLGNPLAEMEALGALGEAGAVIYLVHLKATKRDTLRQWAGLSSRYGQAELGCITLE